MNPLKLRWNWYDWSLSIIVSQTKSRHLEQYFALKCSCCKHFHIGCKDHWFCGLCESCRLIVEE